jgi:hypothetical protein
LFHKLDFFSERFDFCGVFVICVLCFLSKPGYLLPQGLQFVMACVFLLCGTGAGKKQDYEKVKTVSGPSCLHVSVSINLLEYISLAFWGGLNTRPWKISAAAETISLAEKWITTVLT